MLLAEQEARNNVAIAILEVSTFSKIPAFVPFGVLYYVQDTQQIYVGTGSSTGAAVNLVGGGGVDTVLLASTSQVLNLSASGNLYVDATAGVDGIELTLPSAVGLGGRSIQVVMVDTGIGGVTIHTTNGQTIDGSSNYALTNQWQTFTAKSNGANWRIVAVAG